MVENEICHVPRNIFGSCEALLDAGVWHFESSYEMRYVELQDKNTVGRCGPHM